MTKIDKATKLLGDEVVNELSVLDKSGLKSRVTQACESMRIAYEELEANEKYQEFKENVKAVSAGKREVDKYQKAIIAVSLHMLETAGDGL